LAHQDDYDAHTIPFRTPSGVRGFVVNQARANNAVVTLGTNGEITVKCVMPIGSTGTTHFVLDVSGYFQ